MVEMVAGQPAGLFLGRAEMAMDDEQYFPTVAFGFPEGDKRLHQMWIGNFGTLDWRPVPIIKLGKVTRQPTIAGVLPWEDDDGNKDD